MPAAIKGHLSGIPKARRHRQKPPPEERAPGEKARSSLYDRHWQRFRRYFLNRNPFCVHCQKKGKEVEATEVDHVTPHKGKRESFYKTEFQALCKPCHSAKTAKENAKPWN